MSIVYLQQDKSNFNEVLGIKCAQLYCRIWKEAPWCENFWTPVNVLAKLQQQLEKSQALCWLALSSPPKIVGFSWGFGVSRDELAEIASGHMLDSFFSESAKIFYFSELGVDTRKRHGGIGKKLTEKLVEHAKNCGYNKIMLRTDIRATAARTLYEHLGFKELGIKDAQFSERIYYLLEH
ncbi:MAG: GNAT family N-acetyltransferase [Candidatus Buchananbacteria bacterium]